MPTLIATARCNPDPRRPCPDDRVPHRVRVLTLGFAVALHGAAISLALRASPQSEPDQPPQVLQVRWIPAAQPAPQPVQPTLVPKSAPANHRPARPVNRRPPPQRPVRPLPSTTANPSAPTTTPPTPPEPATRRQPDTAPADAAANATPPAPAEPPPASTPPSLDAHYLSNPAPDYPPRSRELEEQGLVRLRIDVGADGKPLTVQIYRSSGYERLDLAAVDAVQHWRFVPARRGAVAVAGWVIVPISFTLRS